MDISHLSVKELLKLHADVSAALRENKVTRSGNSPTGDLAEYLFCKAFDWKRSENSQSYFDAIDEKTKEKYQIKGCRLVSPKQTPQLSALRKFENKHFHYLAAVLFDQDYNVTRAAIIPYSVVKAKVKPVPYTNSHKFILTGSVWDIEGVRDVTDNLRIAFEQINHYARPPS